MSARLNGDVKSTLVGTTTYYFEYGTTSSYGSVTDVGSVDITDTSIGIPVTETVVALTENTEYHYRLCVHAVDDVGGCTDDMTFTTTIGRDSVTGTGFVFRNEGAGLAIGGSTDVHGSADGYFPTGYASTGAYVGAESAGPVTCLRVEGHRATVGFTTADAPHTSWMVTVEDNGPGGDRWSVSQLGSPAADCPVPTSEALTSLNLGGGLLVGPSVVAGDFVVHDHIDEL